MSVKTDKALANSIYTSEQFSSDQTYIIDEMFTNGIDVDTISQIAYPWLSALSMSILIDYIQAKNTISVGEISKYQSYGEQADDVVQQIYIGKLHKLSKEKIDIIARPDIKNRKIIRILLEKDASITEDDINLLSKLEKGVKGKFVKLAITDFINGKLDIERFRLFIKILDMQCNEGVIEELYYNLDSMSIKSIQNYIDFGCIFASYGVDVVKEYITKLNDISENDFRKVLDFVNKSTNPSIKPGLFRSLLFTEYKRTMAEISLCNKFGGPDYTVVRTSASSWHELPIIDYSIIVLLTKLKSIKVSKDIYMEYVNKMGSIKKVLLETKDFTEDELKIYFDGFAKFHKIEGLKELVELSNTGEYSTKTITDIINVLDDAEYNDFITLIEKHSGDKSLLVGFFKDRGLVDHITEFSTYLEDSKDYEVDDDYVSDTFEYDFAESFASSKSFKPICGDGEGWIDLVSNPGTHIINIKKDDKKPDTYMYIFKIENGGEILEYASKIKTKKDTIKALKNSILLIDNIPRFKEYVIDLKASLDTIS